MLSGDAGANDPNGITVLGMGYDQKPTLGRHSERNHSFLYLGMIGVGARNR
jgi:hypothetical protein